MKLEGKITHGFAVGIGESGVNEIVISLGGGMVLTLAGSAQYNAVIAFGPIGSYVDLTKYYTKTETNTLLGGKADKSDTYTKGEVNEMFSHVNIDMDDTPTNGSNNAVSSGGVYSALSDKVDKVNGKGLSSNDYTDTDKEKLAGIESGAEANVQSDWNESNASSDAYIKNKPTLANVATSGSYDDLTNKPSIPAAQVQSDWNQSNSSAVDFIKNKPTIPDAQVQTDWNQSNSSSVDYIKNKPSIPSKTSDLNNDSGFLTEHQSLSNYYTKTEVDTALGNKQNTLTFDNVPTANSANPVKSGGVKTAIDSKQDTLVSGTNIKTINSTSILGSGDISIPAGATGATGKSAYQSYVDTTSDNPVKTEAQWVASLRGADGVTLGDVEMVQTTGTNTDKVMSQDAVTKELRIAKNELNISYICGRLANFTFTDYPEFDPRTSDGISIVFACNAFVSMRFPVFAIINPSASTNQGTYGQHFALWDSWSNQIFGKISNYGGTIHNGGYSFGSGSKGKHVVLTYDFATGVAKRYFNGVLETTKTPTTFSEQTDIRDYFNTCTNMYLSSFSFGSSGKMGGIAVFGRVLSDADVASLYGGGRTSIKEILIDDKWTANLLHPVKYTGSNIGTYIQGGLTRTTDGDKAVLTCSATGTVTFGFNGISGVKGNQIYEWDMTIVSGTWTPYHNGNTRRVMQYNGAYPNVVHIYDSNDTEVTDNSLTAGTYHVVCTPDNLATGLINAQSNQLIYRFTEVDQGSVMEITNLKITERGAALIFSTKNYKGDYWLQPNGIKLTTSPAYYYATEDFSERYDTYINDTVMYSSSAVPNFNGQIAIDTTNNKVYIGYLTSTGGTWKQVNNS